MKFWKVNSRKFFAVPEDDLLAPSRKRSKRKESSSADSAYLEDSLDDIRHEVESIKSKMDKLFAVTKNMPVPPGLKSLLHDALKCKICHEVPVKPPIIFAKCCKSILGCQTCVDEWYADGGLSKTCPACRSPRGLSETMQILGLDELADGVRDILDD